MKLLRLLLAKAGSSSPRLRPIRNWGFLLPLTGDVDYIKLIQLARQYDFAKYFQSGLMAKKKQHGGKREGAGRPPGPDGPTVLIGATVPEKLVVDLDALCEAKGWKRSKAVTEAIRGLLKRKGGA